jgi:hypothetical protein
MIKKTYTKKQRLAIVEAKLLLSSLNFYKSFNPIVRKLFGKQIMAIYHKGRDDVLDDYEYLNKQWKKLGIKQIQCGTIE